MNNLRELVLLCGLSFAAAALWQFVAVDFPNCALAGIWPPLVFCAAGVGFVAGLQGGLLQTFDDVENSVLSVALAFYLGAWMILIVAIPSVWAGRLAGMAIAHHTFGLVDARLCELASLSSSPKFSAPD